MSGEALELAEQVSGARAHGVADLVQPRAEIGAQDVFDAIDLHGVELAKERLIGRKRIDLFHLCEG